MADKLPDNLFRPIVRGDDVLFIWEDCSVGFRCVTCRQEIILDDQGEEKSCECGRAYRLLCHVGVYDPGRYTPDDTPSSDGQTVASDGVKAGG